MTGKQISETLGRKPAAEERSELNEAIQKLGEKLIRRLEYQRLSFGKLD